MFRCSSPECCTRAVQNPQVQIAEAYEIMELSGGVSLASSFGMKRRNTPQAARNSNGVGRRAVLEAAANLLARGGGRDPILWSTLARELGTCAVSLQARWGSSITALLAEATAHHAQRVNALLLCTETSPGSGLSQIRRLVELALTETASAPLAPLALPPPPGVRGAAARRRERIATLRARVLRLVRRGQTDGSIATGDADAASELVIALLLHQWPHAMRADERQVAAIGALVVSALVVPAPPDPADRH